MMQKMKRRIAIFLGLTLLLPGTAYASDGREFKTAGIEKLKTKIEMMKTEQAEFLAAEEVKKNQKAMELHS